MGKRSTQNTKSGRAMNPADQARKEARRKELKKNKIQRKVVREAVVKAKDPKKVIEELERLDQMEYNINEAPPLPDHVLLERRRRLLGNFNRCLGLYEKDDKTTYADLKKMLAQYHRKHDDLRRYYDSVKRAQTVTVDDIPLPMAMPEDDSAVQVEPPVVAVRPVPQGPKDISASRFLSWEAFSDNLLDTGGKRPPGPPCCPPPTLSDDSDEEAEMKEEPEEAEGAEGAESEEEDNELTDKQTDKQTEEGGPSGVSAPSAVGGEGPTEGTADPDERQEGRFLRPSGTAFTRPPFVPPGANFRNVPPPNMMQQRFLPPRPGHPRMMIRGPPIGPMVPGLRPAEYDPMARPSVTSSLVTSSPVTSSPVTSAEQKAMIEAKPQLRNLMAEVTRLIPTSVKVKREEIAKPKPKPMAMGPNTELIPHRPAVGQSTTKGSADQAYDDFLKEMDGLL